MIEIFEFQEWLENRRLSKNYVKCMMYYLGELSKLGDFSQENINNLIARYNQQMTRAFIKNYMKFLRLHGNLSNEQKEILLDIEIPEISGRHFRRLPNVISKMEVEVLHDGMEREGSRIMLLLNFYCGLRISELCNIRKNSFNWIEWKLDKSKNGLLKVIGKGDKEANILVPPFLMQRIDDFIINHPLRYKDDNKKMFISPSRWKQILGQQSEMILHRHIYPHMLRHGWANYLIEKGWNIHHVQEMLRHESINTTIIYLQTSKKQLNQKFTELLEKEESEKKAINDELNKIII